MELQKSVSLDHANFNAANVASKDEVTFVKEMTEGSLFSEYSEADRVSLFKKAHALCSEAVKPKDEKPAAAKPSGK